MGSVVRACCGGGSKLVGGRGCCGGCNGCCCCWSGGHDLLGGDGCCGGCNGCCGGCNGCNGCHGCHGGLFRKHGGCHGCNGCCGGCYGGACNGCAGGSVTVGEMPKAESAAPANIVVSLPAEAKLMIDGNATTSTGERRTFVSPTLEVGQEYYYTVKAEFKGEVREERVTVTAGQDVNVKIEFPAAV